MQLTLFVITTFAAFASAVNILGFATYNCPLSGSVWACPNQPSGRCCGFPRNIRSMFWRLPARAGGVGYNGRTCNGVRYPAFRGTRCVNYETARYRERTPQPQDPFPANQAPAVRSSKWAAGLSTRHVARAESQLETRDEDCIPVSVFSFTYGGTTTVIKVPEGSIEKVADLDEKKDYEGLKALSKGWQTFSESLGLDSSAEVSGTTAADA